MLQDRKPVVDEGVRECGGENVLRELRGDMLDLIPPVESVMAEGFV